ncbi:MAG: adenosylcobinamide kinase/adenosylcobinamide-phosphate guanylyltransferase [Candidatus Endobugula sp.]|jgi:adenosylcobinamide kinase/adenosylcobinamide-phosphate guanylyltransferase
MTRHLILGGARSGKSRFAEEQAIQEASARQQTLHYIATATTRDDSEMQSRIVLHQQRRDARWVLIEEPLDIAVVIANANEMQCVLIDCLTLWLTNALMQNRWEDKKLAFIEAVKHSSASLFFVSNEVGSGIVPMGELSRQFVDEAGWLHQTLAEHCDQVSLVVAGLPLALKPNRHF